jgi:hypothetical protein
MVKRQEIQEYPNKSFADAINDKVSRSSQGLIEQKNICEPDKTHLEDNFSLGL